MGIGSGDLMGVAYKAITEQVKVINGILNTVFRLSDLFLSSPGFSSLTSILYKFVILGRIFFKL